MEQKIALPDHTVRALRYLSAVANLVAHKGAMYGNSLNGPFSGKLTGTDGPTGIYARLEDKLNRFVYLRSQGVADTEDTIADIIGYFALLATWKAPPLPQNVIDIGPFLDGNGKT